MSTAFKSVGVARVSTKGQELEGYSLGSQKKLQLEYAQSHDLIPMKTFEIAETASKATQRKIFSEIMAFIKQEDIKHLVVEKVDRHARNFHDAVDTQDWLMEDAGRRVHFIKDGIILHKESKSQEYLNWGIKIVLAKNYIDNLREEAMKGWAEKLAQGWLPSQPPVGYMTVSEHGKKIHVPNPDTSAIIKSLFELYLDPSQSISTVTREMDLRGIRTSKGRPYARSKVEKMLKNKFYIGVLEFNGKQYPGAQELFITPELFKRVQTKLHGKRPPRLNRHNPVFKNLITCEKCGGTVTWQLQKGRYYGMCQRLKPECQGRRSIREDRIEEQLLGQLNKLVCPAPGIVDWVSNELRKRSQETQSTNEQSLKGLATQIERLERMDRDLYDDKLAGEISREFYAQKHQSLIEQKVVLQDKVASLNNGDSNRLEQRLAILQLSQKASEIYQTRTTEQKRLILTKLFSSMLFKDGAVSVKYSNFVSIIADKSLKTGEILGGKK